MRLTQFTGETPSEVQNVLDIMQKQGARGLILDLRFNPGGLLRSATSVADEFITAGPLVSTKGRQIPRSVVNARRSGTSFPGGRLAVLINEHSASASEILSGALLDHKRALVVGRRTYGKGSVQNVIPIRRHNAFLKLRGHASQVDGGFA